MQAGHKKTPASLSFLSPPESETVARKEKGTGCLKDNSSPCSPLQGYNSNLSWEGGRSLADYKINPEFAPELLQISNWEQK